MSQVVARNVEPVIHNLEFEVNSGQKDRVTDNLNPVFDLRILFVGGTKPNPGPNSFNLRPIRAGQRILPCAADAREDVSFRQVHQGGLAEL
jgi:hypothetical protein